MDDGTWAGVRVTSSRTKSSHMTRDGRQKVRFKNRTEARIVAARRTSETGELYEAYGCRRCTYWHIGKTKGPSEAEKNRAFEVDYIELGERVFWNAWHENTWRERSRVKAILTRCRRFGREAIPSRSAA